MYRLFVLKHKKIKTHSYSLENNTKPKPVAYLSTIFKPLPNIIFYVIV